MKTLKYVHRPGLFASVLMTSIFLFSCSGQMRHMPDQIVDLSPTITEDMPVRLLGPAFFEMLGMEPTVEFKHYIGEPPLYYLDTYLTLFNHAGPHVDAPRHMIPNTAAVDEYDLKQFFGKAKVLDFSNRAGDQFVTLDEVKAFNIQKDDIVIFYCGYTVEKEPGKMANYTVPDKEAATYLAELPVRCYCTDGMAVDNMPMMVDMLNQGESDLEDFAPVHYAFLTRGIPIIEGLQNLEAIAGYKEVVFSGFPLKTTGQAGDAAPLRAVAMVY